MTRSELEIIIKKRAAITVTIFAALLAINTMVGSSNSSKVLTNTIQANNMWAWYQAKNVRSVVYDVAGRADAAARMKMDMEDIMPSANTPLSALVRAAALANTITVCSFKYVLT